jgi:putative ATP-dependent endonuclease of the OLD family
MEFRGFKLHGKKCFEGDEIWLEPVRSINVIVGPNNVGKSTLCDMIAEFIGGRGMSENFWDFCFWVPDPEWKTLTNGRAEIRENWWKHDGGHTLVSTGSSRSSDSKNYYQLVRKDELETKEPITAHVDQGFLKSYFKSQSILRMSSDRNIVPQNINPSSSSVHLMPDGTGITEVLHRLMVVSHESPRNFDAEITEALNDVVREDPRFESVLPRGAGANSTFEIVLKCEGQKGIPLSQCGSGLKTILFVLTLTIGLAQNHDAYPLDSADQQREPLVVLEEVENNLHPEVLKRLLQHILEFQQRTGIRFFLTTHSAIVVDFFAEHDVTSIFRISKKEGKSVIASITSKAEHWDTIRDLGYRPSDMLLANGVIWVEGPSERVYLNRLIALWSEEKYRDGTHYAIVDYGGSCLANFSAEEPSETDEDLLKALSVSRNLYVVCDSDRLIANAKLKDRVARVIGEVENAGGSTGQWVTECKEFENYIPLSVLQAAYQKLDASKLREPGQFEAIWADESKFWKETGIPRPNSKREFAMKLAKHMTLINMQGRHDIDEQMDALIAKIREWNK